MDTIEQNNIEAKITEKLLKNILNLTKDNALSEDIFTALQMYHQWLSCLNQSIDIEMQYQSNNN